ncbi:hypothetical protein C7999DRAFT_36616 [Corynascus novoguineensis]|uniref:Ankyrin repeat protein n=1 Tax=Corynascus novoguineensis TaxID=1126955 RepID=A0AAN7HK55_9PEZI|nr:hypothetical protein C7999DRAFT_36616 [Corynascus novoguineensis]
MADDPRRDKDRAAQKCALHDPISADADVDDQAILKALLRSVKDGQVLAFDALLDEFDTSALTTPAASIEQLSAAQRAHHQKERNGIKLTEDEAAELEALAGGDKVLRRIFSNADKLDFCKVLLKHGWDPNRRIEDTSTPLSVAVGCPETVRWLLENGADPNARVIPGGKADVLTIAAAKRPKASPQVIKLLLEHGADVRETHALHVAASRSGERVAPDERGEPDPAMMEILRILLDAGANVNQMDPDPKGPDSLARNGRQRTFTTGTPLHHAVAHGSPEAVSYLLARDADLSAPSWSGHTAMQAAERAQRDDILEVIALHKKQWAA